MPALVEDRFDLVALDASLAATPFHNKLHFFPSIHSTNTYAMAEGESGAPDGITDCSGTSRLASRCRLTERVASTTACCENTSTVAASG